jgi:hypothetical protein
MPVVSGRSGRLVQPVLSGERTHVRGEIKNNNRNREKRGMEKRCSVRIDSGELNEVTTYTPPKRGNSPGDEEQGRGSERHFTPGLHDKTEHLTSHLGWRKPDR